MNETERIIEVSGYSKQVPITWHEDPTRHLLNETAVNAKSKSDRGSQPSHPIDSSKPKKNRPAKAD